MRSNPYPNVTAYKDRHGKTRYRYRRVGLPVFTFTNSPESEGFQQEYELASAGRRKPKRKIARKSLTREPEPSLKVLKGASVVYVVGHQYGPVKVGWSTDIRARLKDLQTAQHRPLKVMALIEGGPELEREIHARFGDRRIRGEWFRWDAELRDHIASLLANQKDRNLANLCNGLT